MELYMKVSFGLGVFGCVIRLIMIGGSDYPRIKKENIGTDLFMFIVGLGFTIWAGSLLYANN